MAPSSAHATNAVPPAAPALVKHRVLWWIVTGLFCLMMTASGLAYLARAEPVLQGMAHLGYPAYLLHILGVAKLLGVAAVLAPQIPRGLRDWAYAGFTFDTLGAVWSSLEVGDGPGLWLPPLVVLALVQASFWLGRRGRTGSRQTGLTDALAQTPV